MCAHNETFDVEKPWIIIAEEGKQKIVLNGKGINGRVLDEHKGKKMKKKERKKKRKTRKEIIPIDCVGVDDDYWDCFDRCTPACAWKSINNISIIKISWGIKLDKEKLCWTREQAGKLVGFPQATPNLKNDEKRRRLSLHCVMGVKKFCTNSQKWLKWDTKSSQENVTQACHADREEWNRTGKTIKNTIHKWWPCKKINWKKKSGNSHIAVKIEWCLRLSFFIFQSNPKFFGVFLLFHVTFHH